ncbi:hypothetical protein GCM10009413_05540 [Tatumella punctata]
MSLNADSPGMLIIRVIPVKYDVVAVTAHGQPAGKLSGLNSARRYYTENNGKLF